MGTQCRNLVRVYLFQTPLWKLCLRCMLDILCIWRCITFYEAVGAVAMFSVSFMIVGSIVAVVCVVLMMHGILQRFAQEVLQRQGMARRFVVQDFSWDGPPQRQRRSEAQVEVQRILDGTSVFGDPDWM